MRSVGLVGNLCTVRPQVLWGGRSSPGLLQRRWPYYVLGVALIATGAFVFITAHAAHPVRHDSRVADYQLETKNGKYFANHLKLAGDSTDYVFDAELFEPRPPDQLEADAPITVWLDEGSTRVLAIQLPSSGPQLYTTQGYRDPNFELEDNRHGAEAIAGGGILLLAIGTLVGWLMNRPPRPSPPVPETERDDVPEGRGRLLP